MDDDKGITDALHVILEHAGYCVSTAAEAAEALRQAYSEHPDVVLLDVGLPDQDGFEVLSSLRSLTDVPIIMLTARAQPADTVRGLDGGADDYITKPFDYDVLLARLRLALRKHRRRAAGKNLHAVDDRLTVDFGANRVIVSGHDVELTPIEWRILRRLIESEGQAVSIRDLLQAGWGDSKYRDERSVKVRISAIRRKINDRPHRSRYIHTEREMGYRFEPRH